MLDQSLRTHVGFTNLALGTVIVEKPVISERLRVLLFRLSDAFSCLLLESLQLPLANPHSGTYFQLIHCNAPFLSSTLLASATSARTDRPGIAGGSIS